MGEEITRRFGHKDQHEGHDNTGHSLQRENYTIYSIVVIDLQKTIGSPISDQLTDLPDGQWLFQVILGLMLTMSILRLAHISIPLIAAGLVSFCQMGRAEVIAPKPRPATTRPAAS